MENREELQKELKIIEKWEKEQKGLWFWERLARFPFKLLDKFTPAFIQNKIALLLDELGSYIQTGGKYLTKEQTLLAEIQNANPSIPISTIEDIRDIPLQQMIKHAEHIKNNRTTIATVQGASTGVGGIFTLAIDIPVILGLSLKTLQEMAIIHGYDPQIKEERIFIVKCLQFASADIVGKEAILNELTASYQLKTYTKEMASQIQGWREVIYTYRDSYGWKKLLQMIPIAGILFGAYANRAMVKDLSDAGMMLYRKRRILEKLEQIKTI